MKNIETTMQYYTLVVFFCLLVTTWHDTIVVVQVKTTLRNLAIHIKITPSIVRVDIITLYHSLLISRFLLR